MNCKKSFALIGFPLGHSLSPLIHNELFRISGLNAEYKLAEIAPQDIKSSVNELKKLNGFNVTIPHKTNIIPFLDKLSEKAELYGAVNTVDIKNDFAVGYNTDCDGFLNALKGADISLSGKVLICGGGGVSRMFAFESVLAGADVTLAVRKTSTSKAEKIREELREKLKADSKIVSLSEADGEFDLIINGTPAGMFPNIDECPLSERVIKSSGAVFDAIYNPRETVLLRYAKEAGIKFANGLSMLVWQAAAAEEIWNGVKFDEKDIEKVMKVTQRSLMESE